MIKQALRIFLIFIAFMAGGIGIGAMALFGWVDQETSSALLKVYVGVPFVYMAYRYILKAGPKGEPDEKEKVISRRAWYRKTHWWWILIAIGLIVLSHMIGVVSLKFLAGHKDMQLAALWAIILISVPALYAWKRKKVVFAVALLFILAILGSSLFFLFWPGFVQAKVLMLEAWKGYEPVSGLLVTPILGAIFWVFCSMGAGMFINTDILGLSRIDEES